MTVILIIVLLLALGAAGWWFGPELLDEMETARRRRRIDQIKRRNMADVEYLREHAWRERDAHSRDQLRRLSDEYDL